MSCQDFLCCYKLYLDKLHFLFNDIVENVDAQTYIPCYTYKGSDMYVHLPSTL